MKYLRRKLARFKQWILSIVIKRYSITPLTNDMMLENNRRYLKLKDEILNVL
jgi:hypothetical protein